MRGVGILLLLIAMVLGAPAQQKWKANPPAPGPTPPQLPPMPEPPAGMKVISDGNYCVAWVPIDWAQNGTAEGIAPNGLHVVVRAEKTTWDAVVERFKAEDRRVSKSGESNLLQDNGFLLLEIPGKTFRFKAARPATDPRYICTAEAWGGNHREDVKALASRVQGSGRYDPNPDISEGKIKP